MSNLIKAVFWDIDNTLLLNGDLIIKSFIEVIKKYKDIPVEKCKKFPNIPFDEIWEISNHGQKLPIEKQQFSLESVEYYCKNSNLIKPRIELSKYISIFKQIFLIVLIMYHERKL